MANEWETRDGPSVSVTLKGQRDKDGRYDFTEDVLKARAGDSEAFENLYWKALPYLEREAKRFFPKQQDAEDALQEVFLRIYEKLGTLRDPKTFLGWAITICKTTCINRVKSMEVHTGKDEFRPLNSEEDDDSFYAGMDTLTASEYRRDVDPSAHVDNDHVVMVVRSILEELPENQQMCLLLWMEGYSTREIAEELNMAQGTVKSNINYAKKKVRTQLEKMMKEGSFDYHAVSADPVGAFLYLLEQYYSRAPATPSAGDALLKAIRPGLESVGVASGAAGTAATAAAQTGVRATARRIMKRPASAVTALAVAIAITIGVALGVQTLSNRLPVEVRDRVPSTQAVSERQEPQGTEQDTQPDATGDETPDEDNENAATPVVTEVPTPDVTQGGGNGGGNASVRTQSTTMRSNGRLVATELTDLDAGETTAGQLGQAFNGLSQLGGSGTPIAQNKVTLYASEVKMSNRVLAVDVEVINSTDSVITLTAIDSFVGKDREGNTFARGSFDLSSPLKIPQNEYRYVRLQFPEGTYDSKVAKTVVSDSSKINPNAEGHLIYTKSSNSATSGKAYKVAGTPAATTITNTKEIQLYDAAYSRRNGKIYLDVSVQNLTGKKVRITGFDDFVLSVGWNSPILEADVVLDSPLTLKNNETAALRMEFPESIAKRDSSSDYLLYMKYNAVYREV